MACGRWVGPRPEVVGWLQSTGRTADDLVSYFVRFTRPVPVPDTPEGTTVTISGRVTATTDEVATVSIEVSVDGQTVLGNAKAEVRA